MARVGAEAGEGSRRRLPSWMASIRKSGSGDAVQTCSSKEISDTNSNSTVKCETKRRTRARKKVRESIPRKKLKPKSYEIEDDDDDDDDDDDEEVTLNVDDLLSIAKEYVQADRDIVELQSSNRDFESAKQLSVCTSLENDLRGPFNTPNNMHRLHTDSATTFCNSTLSLRSDQSLLSANRTGDPAQDMLDLFLGPLLQRPLEEGTRTNFTKNDVEFSSEFRKLSQNEVGEENVPLLKPKNSLKDKVAILLD